MSIYICDECGKTKDDDYEPCCSISSRPLDFICPECFETLDLMFDIAYEDKVCSDSSEETTEQNLADQLHDELIDESINGGLDIEG